MKKSLLRAFALICLLAIPRLSSEAQAAEAATPSENLKPGSAPVEKKKSKTKAPKKSPPPTAQAAEVNAIVEKHRQRDATAREARRAQTQAQLRAELPSDSAGRKRWRDQLRAAAEAEHAAAIEADEAMRAELEQADNKRHAESPDE
jgi:type IV secretory pathway VirB10-like protein